MPKKYDVIIVGSGPIAITSTLLLIKNNLKVALVVDDKYEREHVDITAPARLFAIAHQSREVFKEIDLDEELESKAQSINHIRVVDDDSYSKVDFSPYDIQLENFGYMIDEALMIASLKSKLKSQSDKFDFYTNNQPLEIQHSRFFARLRFGDEELRAPLLIAADGKHSTVRKVMVVETKHVDYNETAIVVDIKHSSWPHQGVAVEKFTPNGPFAILPKYDEGGTHSSLVWIEHGKLTKDDLFQGQIMKDLIMRKLDSYLGDIEIVSNPLLYHLNMVQSKERYKDRVVFLGDAAQAIHPVAGQGFNLGMRDIIALMKLIFDARYLGLDIGSSELLKNYSKSREFDVEKMIMATTYLDKLFSNDILPLKLIRRVGLRAFDKCSYIKDFTMKYASGF